MKKVNRALTLLFGLLLAAGAIQVQGEVYNAWNGRMKIRFQMPISGTLTNFPTLVTLNTNIAGFLYSDFHSPTNGADLRFAASDQTTELNYEIEEWNTNGNSYVWVQVPQIASTNDYIYAYWGNTTNAPSCTTNGSTWDSQFMGVWHFGVTNGAMDQRDSTTNHLNGSNNGATNAVGGVGYCRGFDGANHNISAGSPAAPAVYTMECVVRRPTLGGGFYRFFALGAGDTAQMWAYESGNIGFGNVNGIWSTWNGVWADKTAFYHIAVVATNPASGNSSPRLYVNGADKGTITVDSSCTSTDIRMGGSHVQFFTGLMDEARISSVQRSSNWLSACWMNQMSNETFVAFSDLVSNRRRGTVIIIK